MTSVGMRRRLPDIAGVLWVLGAAAVVMVPALAHGAYLGPFDLLSRYGLSAQAGVSVHSIQATDQIAELNPWTSLAWTQVHAGHLPLWDPYNALGLPLAFNWQSATFSVPALIGYLAPMRLAYTVGVFVTLVVAGTGTYVFARLLRIGVLGAALAATVFELSGSFMGFLGWPIAGVLSWTGWLFAGTLVVVRGRHRVLGVLCVALAMAAAVYAGQPDALVVLGPAVVVFAVALLLARARFVPGVGRPGRAVGDLAVGVMAGFALSAPLLLPGLQLVLASVFIHAPKTGGALPAQSLVSMLLPGYSATSRVRNQWFDVGAADYVGLITVVLAAIGVTMRRRRPAVVAVAASGIVMFLLAFGPGVSSVLNALPFRARWHLAVVLVSFAAAVLAGVGADVMVRSARQPAVRTWLAAGFGVGALVLAALRVVGIGGALVPAAAHERSQSFIWPAVEVVVGLAALGLLAATRTRGSTRPRWWAAAVLVACQTASLAGVGASVWSSSPTFAAPTAATTALHQAVGTAVVGFGSPSCELPTTIGILPEANTLFGVRELSAYDPVTPNRDFEALGARHTIPVSAFCPVLHSATEARRFGVGYVLVRAGAPVPVGTTYVRTIAGERLYRVPGAAPATLTARRGGGALPALDAPGTPVPVTQPNPASWRMVVHAPAPSVLRLHLSDVPGWHATVDGHAVALERFAGMMLQLRVPAGRHIVEVSYLPSAFVVGVVFAAVAAAGLAIMAGVVGLRRRRGARQVAAASAQLSIEEPAAARVS